MTGMQLHRTSRRPQRHHSLPWYMMRRSIPHRKHVGRRWHSRNICPRSPTLRIVLFSLPFLSYRAVVHGCILRRRHHCSMLGLWGVILWRHLGRRLWWPCRLWWLRGLRWLRWLRGLLGLLGHGLDGIGMRSRLQLRLWTSAGSRGIRATSTRLTSAFSTRIGSSTATSGFLGWRVRCLRSRLVEVRGVRLHDWCRSRDVCTFTRC